MVNWCKVINVFLHLTVLAGRATTNDELENMLESGNPAIFTQGVSGNFITSICRVSFNYCYRIAVCIFVIFMIIICCWWERIDGKQVTEMVSTVSTEVISCRRLFIWSTVVCNGGWYWWQLMNVVSSYPDCLGIKRLLFSWQTALKNDGLQFSCDRKVRCLSVVDRCVRYLVHFFVKDPQVN